MPQNVNLRDLLIVIVEEEDVLAVVDQFLHHHVLTLEVNELALGPRDRLQEVDVLDVALVSLDVVDEKAEKKRRRDVHRQLPDPEPTPKSRLSCPATNKKE